MKKPRRWFLGVLGALGLALIGLMLARNWIFKAVAERSVRESTGLRTEIGECKTLVGSGVFRLRDLKLYNPPEFGGTLLADVPELEIDVDAGQLASGIVHFRKLTLHLAELNVLRNARGRLNLEGVEKAMREHLQKKKKKKGEKFEFDFGGIDQAQLSVGRILYRDLQKPSRNCCIDLAMKNEVIENLRTEEDLQNWAGAILFRVLMQQSLKPSGVPAGEEPAGAAAPLMGISQLRSSDRL
jgi:hypothetical protein